MNEISAIKNTDGALRGASRAIRAIDAPINMLLAEDDPDSGEATRAMLERRGIKTKLVPDAEQCLSDFKTGNFDIIVADIRLRGMSGVDLLRCVRNEQPDFPVILLTGYESMESAVEAVRLGANDYIVKPLNTIDDVVLPAKEAVRSHRLIINNRVLEMERERAKKELERSHEQLRSLSARLAEIEEDQRQRLGQELHDQIGQTLSALNINLAFIGSQLPDNASKDTAGRLDDAIRQVEQMGDRVRNIMCELRPPVLTDYGLLAALRWYGKQFSQRTNIAVNVRGEEPNPRLSSKIEMTLFRIAQEALTNVAKHAKADNVTACLSQPARNASRSQRDAGGSDSCIRIDISDNGIGFSISSAGIRQPTDHPASWGILLMKERAESLNGKFNISGMPGKGTTVTVEIPV